MASAQPQPTDTRHPETEEARIKNEAASQYPTTILTNIGIGWGWPVFAPAKPAFKPAMAIAWPPRRQHTFGIDIEANPV
jgi:hypothetical protein